MIRVENLDGNWVGWITRGGGINEGEDEETALELYEELGLNNFKYWAKNLAAD